MRGRTPSRPRLPLTLVGVLAVGALVLAACTPEPPAAPAVPVTSPVTSPTTTSSTTTTTTAPPPTGAACSSAGASEAPVPSADDPVEYVAVTEGTDGRREVHTFEARSSEDRTAKVDQIRAQGGTVLSVEVDVPVYALAIDDPVYLGPPASSYGPQWQIDAVGYEAAWATVGQGAGVRVAVVDTGVYAGHEDLTGAVVAGADFVGGNGDSVGDGWNDPNSHGTHVAGIVAARDDVIGGVGGAPEATVLPVRVLSSSGSGSMSDVVAGILWAANPAQGGADVINLSLGGSCTQAMYDALAYAVSQGVTVVAAAGNGCCVNTPSYPGAFASDIPGVLAVASTTESNDHSSFSNINSYVTIAAPGSAIWSTVPTSVYGNPSSNLYQLKSGTSMATPGVAAAVALVKAKCPAYSPAQIRSRLVSTAQDLGVAGPDSTFGAGLVQADAAVASAC